MDWQNYFKSLTPDQFEAEFHDAVYFLTALRAENSRLLRENRNASNERRRQVEQEREEFAENWANNNLTVGMIVKVKGSRNHFLKQVTKIKGKSFDAMSYNPKTDEPVNIASNHMLGKITHIYIDGTLIDIRELSQLG